MLYGTVKYSILCYQCAHLPYPHSYVTRRQFIEMFVKSLQIIGAYSNCVTLHSLCQIVENSAFLVM